MPKAAVSGERVYQQLRQALLQGDLRAGDHLVELDLARSLEVSRTPVREALRRLEGDGFVQRQGNGSVTVLALEAEDIDEIAMVRVEIDTLAARLAVQRATPEQWEALEGLVAGLRGVDEPDLLDEAHRHFHRQLFAIAFRPRMQQVLQNHVLQHLEVTRIVTRVPASSQQMYRQHRRLLDALRGRDAELAERVAREHAGLNARAVREVLLRQKKDRRS